MEAGRELDALVAEKIFGWIRLPLTLSNGEGSYRVVPPNHVAEPADPVPRFSTDAGAAWSVGEKLAERKITIVRGERVTDDRRSIYEADAYGEGLKHIGHAEAESQALATCIAALRAVGHEF